MLENILVMVFVVLVKVDHGHGFGKHMNQEIISQQQFHSPGGVIRQ
jgi:hypothetical protein